MAFGIKLKPSYDNQKSFYNKANVREEDGKKILKSYTTDVAYIKDGKAYVSGTYSPTTLRHIKEFLLQNGFKAENSKQIMKDYDAKRVDTMKVDDGVTKTDIMKVDNSAKSVTPSISSYGYGKKFTIDDKTEIIAQSNKTRSGFRHTAVLYVDGKEVDKSTAHYLNRTWESYEYQSVVDSLIEKSSYISKEKKSDLKKQFSEISSGKIHQEFKTIGTIASLGDVFGKTEKEKNDWKLRMVKAGLGKGFSEPDDWNSLSEKEKGKRLDMVIKNLNQSKRAE